MKKRRADPLIPVLVNLPTAAKILGISEQRLRQIAGKSIPGRRVKGGGWVFRQVVIERERVRREQEKAKAEGAHPPE